MVPANKILTVAYGTFSCTLEGFDDPFAAMTDIAEYFRDLAADDRFFGAEPPTPDMAMLRTIAEARANKAIEAQPDDGGVVLRPADMTAVDRTDAPTPDVAPAPQVEDAAVEAVEDVVEPPAEEDVVAAPAEIEDPSPAAAEDDVAEKLARIRGVVDVDLVDDGDYAEDEHALDTDAAMGSDIFAAAFEEDAFDVTAVMETLDPVFIDTEAAFEEEAATDEPEAPSEEAEEIAATDDLDDDPAEPDAPVLAFADNAPEEASDPDAADVVSAINAEESFEDRAPEADIQEPISDEEEADRQSVSFADEEEVADLDVAPDPVDEDVEPAAEVDDRGILAKWFGKPKTVAEDASHEEAEEDDAAAEEPARRPRRIRIRKVRRSTVEPLATHSDDDPTDEASSYGAVASIHADGMNSETTDDVRPEAVEQEADWNAQPASRQQDEAAGPTVEEDAALDDDLMAELAAIRAEEEAAETFAAGIGADDAPTTDEGDPDDAIDPALLGHAVDETSGDREDEHATFAAEFDRDQEIEEEVRLTASTEEGGDRVSDVDEAHVHAFGADTPHVSGGEDDVTSADERWSDEDTESPSSLPGDRDMERLFAATDSRLSGEDMSRRHANISHLKAAVAARRAEGPVATQAEDQTGAYREDLAHTVRPRRAARPDETSGRSERPAPLMLVSEQRVETEVFPDGASDPVRPRRAGRLTEQEAEEEAVLRDVAAREDDEGPASMDAAAREDFEQFAADLGAVDLPDVLEAAAVYSAQVMGNERFSRPRLLHLAAEAVDDMSREDGLRGFGQLLRDGTIRKVSRGEFALGGESRFAEAASRRVG
ncbi:MAG: hypothetical protein AAF390_15540 [Pseudomonadota bacterium]